MVFTHELIELGSQGLCQALFRQSNLCEGFLNQFVECMLRLVDMRMTIDAVFVVNLRAQRGVELVDGLLTILGEHGIKQACRGPVALHHELVLFRQLVAAFIEYRQTHRLPLDLDVADLFDFLNPARRHPAKRAGNVEVESDLVSIAHVKVLLKH